MSTVKELFAPEFMKGQRPTDEEQDRMAKELGADSLFYLPLEAVGRCIGLAGRTAVPGVPDRRIPDADRRAALSVGPQKSPTPTGDESKGGDGRTYETCAPTNGAWANGHTPARDDLLAALGQDNN